MTGPDDERLDEMIRESARDYNAPGAVPREAMWEAIAMARRQERAPTAARPAQRPVWLLPGIGIAAALLLSTGIVVGRRMAVDRPSVVASARPARNATPTPDAPDDSVVRQLREETRRTDSSVRRLAQSALGAPSSPASQSSQVPPSAPRSPQASTALAYQLVVMRHLAGADAMITSFRSTAHRGERDPMMAEWSQELLNTTRTLEASRISDDPVMRRLLDDLDLVISQIVQYTAKGTVNPDELDLIEQSINRRGVISKLRSTLPGRQMPAGL